MVIKNAVPIELCNAVIEAIFSFLEMDPEKSDQWYQPPHKPGAGMVEMYQHQAMWNVLQGLSGRESKQKSTNYTQICFTRQDFFS